MTNTIELEIIIMRSPYNKKELAEMLEITELSLKRKINNEFEFKASEIDKLSKALKIKDLNKIFFYSK